MPDDNKIRLVNVTEDGHYEIIKENDSYAAAKVSHTLLQHQYENLGIAKGQTFLSIENGVVEFKKHKIAVSILPIQIQRIKRKVIPMGVMVPMEPF